MDWPLVRLFVFWGFIKCVCEGVVGKLTTHPLDVVKKRYQVAGLQRSLRYGARVDAKTVESVFVCFQTVLRREGIAGLWKGSIPNIIKVRLFVQNGILSFVLGWSSCCSHSSVLRTVNWFVTLWERYMIECKNSHFISVFMHHVYI